MLCRVVPYEGQEPYVFLSYCHQDASRVYPIFEQMALDGYRVWYDDGNHAGDDWVENIAQHLSACDICVAFVSENSSLSHNCKNEVSFAIQCKKKLSTVLLEDFEMTLGMRLQLSSFHYLKRTDFPSNRMLLQKIYETEEIKNCRTTPGSLPMRDIEVEPQVELNSHTHDENIRDFVTHEKKQGLSANIVELTQKTADSTQQAEPKKQSNAAEVPTVEQQSVVEPAEDDSPVLVKKIVKIRRKAAPEKTQEETPVIPEQPEREHASDEESGAASSEKIDVKSRFTPEVQHTPEQENNHCNERTFFHDENDEKTIYEYNLQTRCDDDEERTIRSQFTRTAVLLQPSAGIGFALNGIQIKIGRSQKRCDIVLTNNPSISNYHADIIIGQSQCSIRDAGATFGTFLNGEQLEKGNEVILPNPALFWLSNELLILVSGHEAGKIIERGRVCFLLNRDKTSVRFLQDEPLLLDRRHKWEDGTLDDRKVHRENHAQIYGDESGFYLKDTSPENGNGTYLNEHRLSNHESCRLEAGDTIRLGDTVLEVGIAAL